MNNFSLKHIYIQPSKYVMRRGQNINLKYDLTSYPQSLDCRKYMPDKKENWYWDPGVKGIITQKPHSDDHESWC